MNDYEVKELEEALATAREDALREAADVIGRLPTCSIGTAQEAILDLIDKEPKPWFKMIDTQEPKP